MANRLTLAVAGSGKTQEIVDYCAALAPTARAAVVTFTQTNQLELKRRLRASAGERTGIEVMGWYSFLIRHFARPFLPFMFPGARVRGFNFDGTPNRFATGLNRFLDSTGAAYKCELGRLSFELIEASKGSLIRRLFGCYDIVLIDEVQDLSGYDWEIIDALLESSLDVIMVGDLRQAVLSTNPRGSKNKQYAYSKAIRWFRERESGGTLEIQENDTTRRCRPEIAEFSDTIFSSDWSFPTTRSMNTAESGHDGVFLVHPSRLGEYLRRYSPRCLRDGANSGKAYSLDYLNFGLAKGADFKRVLIVPTAGITRFIKNGDQLDPVPAAKFYVAVTRAEQSVAIVMEDPGGSSIPVWSPPESAE